MTESETWPFGPSVYNLKKKKIVLRKPKQGDFSLQVMKKLTDGHIFSMISLFIKMKTCSLHVPKKIDYRIMIENLT